MGLNSSSQAQVPESEVETHLVTFHIDSHSMTLPTESHTVSEALEEHSLTPSPGDEVSPGLSETVEEGSVISVVYSKSFRLKVGSSKSKRLTLPALTVREALEEEGVKLRERDWVKPGLNAKLTPQMAIKVTRVRTQERVRFDWIRPKTVKRPTANLYRGESRVVKQGKPGRFKVWTESKVVDGKWRWTKEVDRKVIRPASPRILLVGTKARPGLTGVWARLAQCESGGNPRIVSSNGLYHGLFQFSVGTWRSVGGSGLPSQASREEQLKRAKILQARSGWGQWPHCSAVLGLR